MTKKLIEKAFFAFILLIFINACTSDDSHGPLIGEINDKDINFEISIDKIQNGLTTLLAPSKSDFIIGNVEIVKKQNLYFLMITGREGQKCMVALKEIRGKLYEASSKTIPIVVCSGCTDGCEPNWTEEGWYCSDGCEDCEKSTTVSDFYIFK